MRRRKVIKKVLAFDIDHTLGLPRTPIPDEIAVLLVEALKRFEICIISGQNFDQFLKQVIGRLKLPEQSLLRHLHCFPAQGTQYYRFTDHWEQAYCYSLLTEQATKVSEALEQAARELGYWDESIIEGGDKLIDNKHSQVTFAGLGLKANYEEKCVWDPDCAKRNAIIARCEELAPEFEYKIGGTTSIDVTDRGMDKGFGMRHLMQVLCVQKKDILYFGDMTQPGGNDYPVVAMGIDTITVHEYNATIEALTGIIGILA